MGYTSRRSRHVLLLTLQFCWIGLMKPVSLTPENRLGLKRKRLYSNHPFSGAMQAISLGSVDVSMISCSSFQNL